MVSAWGSRNRLVLGQEATKEKSNEITAIPKPLELLELKGCIVTIDAMGCRTKIAAQIVDQGGDYVLGLKGNQSTLHEEVDEFFTTATEGDFADVVHDYTEETDKDHGRLEVRRYWITEALGTLSETGRWKGLCSIGLVERECWIEDRHTVERRLFINSIPADAKRFAHAVRDHWGVENRLHWRLDVVMDALWLTGVLTNKQRADGAYHWRTRVLRTGREIIEIERRARASAEKRGKGEELSEVEESVVAQEVSSEGSETEDLNGETEEPANADAKT